MTAPNTKAARLARIADLLEHNAVPNQARLAELLEKDGVAVTQATLSRDLDELGAVKVVTADGRSVYAVPGEGGDPSPVARRSARTPPVSRLARVAAEVLVCGRGVGQPRRPADASGRGAVPRLGDRPQRAPDGHRHRRGRRHGAARDARDPDGGADVAAAMLSLAENGR